jgi:rare lipoprotein A (peptidoglycan hydrolase)
MDFAPAHRAGYACDGSCARSYCRGVTAAVWAGVVRNTIVRFADRLAEGAGAFALAILIALAVSAITGCSAQTPYYENSPHYSYQSGSRYSSYELQPYSSGTLRGTQVASWYGPGFVGHTTSTGEHYNPNELTAASKTLPLGSRVRVTNPDNGRSVVVRINDRGPFIRGRSLDLSHRAAQQIGLTGKGVGRVQVASADAPVPYTGSESAVADAPRYSRHSSYHRKTRHSRRHRNESVGTWLIGALHL